MGVYIIMLIYIIYMQEKSHMYFQSHNNFYHGIMFHHFHDNKIHKKAQGSIDQDTFYKLIKFIGRENILNADEFFLRFKEIGHL